MDDELRKKLIELLKDKRLLEVIKHLRKANVDYGKSIILNTKIPIQEVVELLDQLEMLGLIERVHGATVKNTEARFKLSKEVHKHHTYYTLTREGDHLLRHLNEEELIRAYIDLVKNDQFALNILKIANEVKIDHALTYTKLTHRRLEEVTP